MYLNRPRRSGKNLFVLIQNDLILHKILHKAINCHKPIRAAAKFYLRVIVWQM